MTTGSWSPLASTNLAGDDPVHKTGFNHYSPACLQEAGGRARGSMDIVQFHTYPWNGAWQTGGPWLGLTPDSYLVEGPVGDTLHTILTAIKDPCGGVPLSNF